MSVDEHVAALKAKHAELDKMLQNESIRPYPDDCVITDIKKQKLRIKDELVQLGGY